MITVETVDMLVGPFILSGMVSVIFIGIEPGLITCPIAPGIDQRAYSGDIPDYAAPGNGMAGRLTVFDVVTEIVAQRTVSAKLVFDLRQSHDQTGGHTQAGDGQQRDF